MLVGGRITEAGSHVDLMQISGEYVWLFEKQIGNTIDFRMRHA
jgi:hypothetical protein